MSSLSKAVFVLLASVSLVGCSPSQQELLSKEWECGSTLSLSFGTDGSYTITSTATNPPGVWQGQYALKDNRISVTGPTAHPLNRYTTITLIGPKDLLLSANPSDVLTCFRKQPPRP